MFAYHRYPFNFLRKLPDFLIIGAQKAGTTSLHHYLSQNVKIKAGVIKEAQFFNMNYVRGHQYYRSIFPFDDDFLTFDATPDYLDHPDVPELCHQLLPKAKLIIMMREPVSRAFSHFNFVQKYDRFESELTFEQALAREEDRVNKALAMRNSDPYTAARHLSNYGYKIKGLYHQHICNWLKYYDKKRMLFIEFSEFVKNPQQSMDEVCEFLDIPPHQLKSAEIKNKTSYDNTLDTNTRDQLLEFYHPHNQKLYELIGEKYNW